MAKKIKVQITRLPHAHELELPAYATPGSVGVDLRAAVESDYTLYPGSIAVIPCGVCIELPEGYEAQIRPRSGLAMKHAVTIINSPATIDSDYRGEIKVMLIKHGSIAFTITRGMRICQLVVAPVTRVEWEEVDELEETERSSGGFGSTGHS